MDQGESDSMIGPRDPTAGAASRSVRRVDLMVAAGTPNRHVLTRLAAVFGHDAEAMWTTFTMLALRSTA
jgi:hypothetical protein